jgi:hypothetical protein
MLLANIGGSDGLSGKMQPNPKQRVLTSDERRDAGSLSWTLDAMRCSFCGCTYTAEFDRPVTFYGWFDPMAGDRWFPTGA